MRSLFVSFFVVCLLSFLSHAVDASQPHVSIPKPKSVSAGIIIVDDPVSQNVIARQNVSFSVRAISVDSISYQWFGELGAISGATNSTLTLTNVQLADAGSYFVLAYNELGAVRSKPARLGVDNSVPPLITQQPLSKSVLAGTNVIFTVEANGKEPLSYQWFQNGRTLTNAQQPVLTLTNVTATNAGSYTVTVTNQLGRVTSAAAVLVINTPPSIKTHPASQVVPPNTNVQFIIEAIGTQPIFYSWFKDEQIVPGATNNNLRLANVQYADAGEYWCLVSNNFGQAISKPATLTINKPVSFLTHPRSQKALVGDNVTFSVEVNGEGPLTYRWFCDGRAVLEGHESVLTLKNVQVGDAGIYRVVVSGPFGSSTSFDAILQVDVPATIVMQPTNQNVLERSSVTLSVGVVGTSPIIFQWYKDGYKLIGETRPSLVMTNASPSDSGRYKVSVSNAYRTLMSDEISLNVDRLLQITLQPKSQFVVAGQSALFAIRVESIDPLSYQWFKDGKSVPGANNEQLIVQTVSRADAGHYRVFVRSTRGQATSDEAELTVDEPIVIQRQPEGRRIRAGESLLLDVSAEGRGLLQYQWLKGGVPVHGASSDHLLIPEARYQDAGEYRVQITDGQFTIQSDKAVVDVDSSVSISVHPQSQVVNPGQRVRFHVEAEGTAALTYQWLKDGKPIPGAVANDLVLERVTGLDAASYSLIASNRFGTATSLKADLRVKPPFGVKGDLNRDGTSDLLFQSSDGFLGLWIMDGEVLSEATYLLPSHLGDTDWNVTTLADFDGDDFDDLLLQSPDGTIGIWRLAGTSQVAVEILPGAGEIWRIAGAADFNRDEHQDLLFQHLDGTLAVWGMRKTQVISSALLKPSHPGDAGWKVAGTGDFNEDGSPDLIFQHTDGTLAAWFLRETDVTGVSLLEPNEPGDSKWRVVSVADRNGDGRSDLLFQHSDGTLGLWLMNGIRMNSSQLIEPSHPGIGWRVVAP